VRFFGGISIEETAAALRVSPDRQPRVQLFSSLHERFAAKFAHELIEGRKIMER